MTTQDANPVCRMHFNVTGMSCAACQARVEKVVSGLDGVENVAVNLLKNTMEVTPKDASQANELTQAIEAAVSEAGYGAQRTDPGAKNASAVPSRAETAAAEAAEVKTRLIYSIVFLVLLMYVSMGSMMGLPMPDWLGSHESGPSYTASGCLLKRPIGPEPVRSIMRFILLTAFILKAQP